MSIRFKVTCIAVGAVLLYGGLDFAIQWLVIRPSFSELEREQANRDMRRCVQALDREIHHLDQFCYDWSGWDDTYAYVVTRSADYETSNLVPASFLDNDLNLLYILDSVGRVIWGEAYDLETEAPITMPDFPKQQWARSHPLLRIREKDDFVSGLVLTSRGMMLTSARPILTSNLEGPMRGFLIMGRFLNDVLMRVLAEQTQVKMQIRPMTGEEREPWSKRVRPGLSANTGYDIRLASEDRMNVSVGLPDAYGNPAFFLQAAIPREITTKGNAAVRLDALFALGIGLGSLLVLLYLMRRTVTAPLLRLTGHVTRIGASGELVRMAGDERRDELGTLSREFNRMVARLERDSAERARSEAALRESEERFQRLLASLDDVVCSTSADGNTLLYVNAAAEQLYGRPREDFEREPGLWLKVIHPDDRDRVEKAFRALFDTAHMDIEYRIVRQDGTVRWVHDRKTAVCDERGKPLRVAGITSDTTALKQMHEKVAESQHLAKVGEMGASVAHEIRNPIAGISAALQVIRGGLREDSAERAAVMEALEQAGRIEQTVQQLLKYSKRWQPDKKQADIRQFTQDLCEPLCERLGQDGYRVTVERGQPILVAFDAALLEEVYVNLIENAAHAMAEGGRIDIAFRDAREEVRVIFRDYGPGFAAIDLGVVLEPFYTTKARGTGLGLSVCQRIMEAHGGAIQLRNADGKGAEVILAFPKVVALPKERHTDEDESWVRASS